MCTRHYKLGTHVNSTGLAPQIAQKILHHSKLKLTTITYTAPTLKCCGALPTPFKMLGEIG